MAALVDHLGRPLKDTAGNPIKNDSTVIDAIFGEGIARGTVPLEKGDGVNVRIDWLGMSAACRPRSRGAENLTLKGAGGFHTTSFTTYLRLAKAH